MQGIAPLFLIFEPDKLATQLKREDLYPILILRCRVLSLYFLIFESDKLTFFTENRDSLPYTHIIVGMAGYR